jgi:citrate lyase alpha subunit
MTRQTTSILREVTAGRDDKGDIVALIEYRDGTLIDVLRGIEPGR